MRYQEYNLFATGFTRETSSCSCTYVLFVFLCIRPTAVFPTLFYLFHFPFLQPLSPFYHKVTAFVSSLSFLLILFCTFFEFTLTTLLISHSHLFLHPLCISQHLLCLLSLCVSVHYVLDVCPTFALHRNMADQVRSLDADNFK